MGSDDESPGGTSPDADISSLLDGLTGDARRERANLIAWLRGRDFTIRQISGSLSPMLLPANRTLGDDGSYVSTREMAEATGMDLELLQRFQRAVGLPQVEDVDAAVLPRADAETAARAKFLVDFGVEPDEAVAVLKVLADGLARAAALTREPTFKILAGPGITEIELAESGERLARSATPFWGPLLEGLLLLQFRHMFEAEAITAAERATGILPGARQVAVGFADLEGFTRLGEALPPDELARMASRLAKIAHEVAAPPVSFVKTIGDAVMFVSSDTARLIDVVFDLFEAAADNNLPRLSAGVACGLAATRAGDWFGSPVNVASRITGIARPGTVLVEQSARDSAGSAEHLVWTQARVRRLRGVSRRTPLFRVKRAQ